MKGISYTTPTNHRKLISKAALEAVDYINLGKPKFKQYTDEFVPHKESFNF